MTNERDKEPHDHRAGSAPASVPLQPDEKDHPEPSDGKCQCHERRRDTLDYLTFGVNVATLIAVVIYACFAYRQAVASRDAADAARNAAEVAEAANELARHNIELAQRAWLMPIAISTMEGVPNAAAVVELKNTGLTPAMYVYMMLAMFIPPPAGELPIPPPYPPRSEHPGLSVVAPGQTTRIDVKLISPLIEALPELKSGTRYLYVYGYTLYWDEFWVPRGSAFCGIWQREDGSFKYCPFYNWAW